MKLKLIAFCTLTALLWSAGLHGQEANRPAPPPDRQQLREQLRNLPPEERQARMRELREQGGFGRGQRQFQGGQQPGMMGGAPGIGRIMMVLTPEQRESLRTANEADREKTRALEEKARDARNAVLSATLDKNFKEKTVRQKLEAAAKLETELTLIRARTFSKVHPPLSDEQIEKIKNPPPMGDMIRQRQGQGPDGSPGERSLRGPGRPRPRGDGPRDVNDLPPPPKP